MLDSTTSLQNLDLNGYTISQTLANKSVFYLYSNAQVSIKDTSAAGTGKVVPNATTNCGGIVKVDQTAVLNIFGGTAVGGTDATVKLITQ